MIQWNGRRSWILVILAALLGAFLPACGASRNQSPSRSHPADREAIRWVVPARPILGLRQRVVGEGPRGAVVLWPAGSPPPRQVVIFFHGWEPLPPSMERGWIAHLVDTGNTVIYPAYQSMGSRPASFLGDASAGIAAALRSLHFRPRRLVAIGRSTGGALAFDFAATARRSGLPAPEAVLAVFPGRHPPGGEIVPADLSQIPRSTQLEVIAGPGDPLPGGEREGRALLRASTAAQADDLRILRPSFPADLPRVAPAVGQAAERRAFWKPADALIAELDQGRATRRR